MTRLTESISTSPSTRISSGSPSRHRARSCRVPMSSSAISPAFLTTSSAAFIAAPSVTRLATNTSSRRPSSNRPTQEGRSPAGTNRIARLFSPSRSRSKRTSSMYFISSPQWPTNGSTRQYEMTTNGFNPNALYGYENTYSDYASLMQQITNGTWTILFTNATTTNLYTFTVSAPSMT